MASSLNSLSEQIWRIYHGGNPSDDVEFNRTEMKHLVTQTINRLVKAQHISLDAQLGENFPAHAIIASFSVTATSETTPTQSITCTDFSETALSLGTANLTVTVNDPATTIQVAITGITWGEVDTSALESFITNCDGAIEFEGPSGVPVGFIVAGITNLVIDGTSITFDYDPTPTQNGGWITDAGNLWITDAGLFWALDESVESEVPTILADYVAATTTLIEADLLEGVGYTEDYGDYVITNVSCCVITTNETSIKATATIPAQPLHLPRNIGLWTIYPSGSPDNIYIPMQSSQPGIVGGITHTNLSTVVAGLTTYQWLDNDTIRFNQPLSTVGTSLVVQLLISDIDSIDADAILPIPADMKTQVIQEVLNILRTAPPADRNNDEISMQ